MRRTTLTALALAATAALAAPMAHAGGNYGAPWTTVLTWPTEVAAPVTKSGREVDHAALAKRLLADD